MAEEQLEVPQSWLSDLTPPGDIPAPTPAVRGALTVDTAGDKIAVSGPNDLRVEVACLSFVFRTVMSGMPKSGGARSVTEEHGKTAQSHTRPLVAFASLFWLVTMFALGANDAILLLMAMVLH